VPKDPISFIIAIKNGSKKLEKSKGAIMMYLSI